MLIKCIVQSCPYSTKNGFCRRKFVFINGNGCCEQIYTKSGAIKQNWQTNFNQGLANDISLKKQQEEKTEGEAGTRSCDAITQVSANKEDDKE